MRSLRASPVFALAVLVALGLAGFNGLMVGLMALRLDFLLPGPFAQMTHFQTAIHRTHDLTFGFLFIPAIVGMLAQFRRPSKNVAGQLMALIPWLGLVLTLVLTLVLANNMNVFGPQWVGVAAATLIATILHPTWRDFFRSFSVSRVNWVMLALVIIAAVPLLVFASTNIGLQGTVTDEHVLMGHYGFMAAFGFTIIGVGVLASLRPDGWWLPAWVAGLLPALLGLTSLVYPDATSSLGLVWALAAIAWGVGFVAAAELTQKAERPTLLGSWGIIPALRGPRGVLSIDDTGVRPAEDRPPGTPRWVNVLGGIALVAVVVLVPGRGPLGNAIVTMVTGGGGPGLHRPGGPGLHTPPRGAHGDASPVADRAVEIAVTANNFAFDPNEITVTLGNDVAVALTSVDTLHDFVIDELDPHIAAGRGETATGGFRAERPGRYTFYCSVPGHRQAGMEGTLIVTQDPTPPIEPEVQPDGPSDHKPPFQH